MGTQHLEGKFPRDRENMCTSLVEIISICYSQHSQRTPKKILRLHNQCFQFCILCKRIIGVPKKNNITKVLWVPFSQPYSSCASNISTVLSPVFDTRAGRKIFRRLKINIIKNIQSTMWKSH